jgi:intermediate cleaving peptidase 55
MVLYSTGKDPSKEKWDGASTRFPDVISLFGADDAYPLENFTDDLRAFVARAQHVYVDLPVPSHRHHHHHHRHHHRRRFVGAAGTRFPFFKYLLSRQSLSSFDGENAETGSSYPYLDIIAGASISKRKSLAPLVGALRSVKSECEVEVMKASAEISSRAHAKVSQNFWI